MKKILLIVFVAILSLTFSSKIRADVVAEYSLKMTLNSDLSSSIDVMVELQNTSETSLISSYSIDFPFVVTNANASLDNNAVNINLEEDSGSSILNIDFLTNVIKPNQKAVLNISLFTLNSVNEFNSAKQLYLPIPTSNYSYSKKFVSITYPIVFGSISYSSEYKYGLERIDDNYSKVSFDQTGPTLLMWGNPQFNINFSTTVSNRKDSTNHLLFNLIPQYENQHVEYQEIFLADYALVDKLNNSFAFVTLNSNGTLALNSNANIVLNSGIANTVLSNSYNWNLNLDSVLGQKIYSQINQGTDTISKFRYLNDFLNLNYSLNTDRITTQSLNEVWEVNKRDLNPLQYCYLIVSTAEYLGLKSNVEYGYNILSSSGPINPSIWCSVESEGKNLVFDFVYQKEVGYSVISTSSVDRVRMGVWHPSQSYNDLMGILSGSLITADLGSVVTPDVVQSPPVLDIEFPKNVFSGEFYSGKVIITNQSAKVLKFDSLNINNESVLKNLEVGELVKAIMPFQTNSIKIDYLRETDFVLNLSREIVVEAGIGEKILTNGVEVRFEPDYKLLALFVIILVVTVSIFVYLIYKLLRRKH